MVANAGEQDLKVALGRRAGRPGGAPGPAPPRDRTAAGRVP